MMFDHFLDNNNTVAECLIYFIILDFFFFPFFLLSITVCTVQTRNRYAIAVKSTNIRCDVLEAERLNLLRKVNKCIDDVQMLSIYTVILVSLAVICLLLPMFDNDVSRIALFGGNAYRCFKTIHLVSNGFN